MSSLIRSLKLLTVGALIATTLAACGDKDEQTGETLVTVNGKPIKESKVNAQLSQIPAELLNGREAEARQQILEGMINQELLAQAAKKEDIKDSDEYKKQMDAFSKQLEANLVIAKKVSDTLTTEQLKQAYDVTKDQRAYPAVKARHILVPSEGEALNLIKVANANNFSELAKQHSKGPSADNGGDLGWFRREAMIPEFAQVAFSTPVGTVSPKPVQTQFGWHVILVEDRKEKYVPPFEQVEQQLRSELTQTVVNGYLQDLRKDATITYAEPAKTEPAAGEANSEEAKK